MGQDAPDWGLEEEAGYTMEVGESKVWTRRVSVWVKWCPCQAKCGAFKSERTLLLYQYKNVLFGTQMTDVVESVT